MREDGRADRTFPDLDREERSSHGDPLRPLEPGSRTDVIPRIPESDMAEQQERRSVAERREQLIDSAITVLTNEGIGAATTRRITDEAGLALGAFHYAFRNKDDLLEAVLERLSSEVERVLQRSILEPQQSLEAFGEAIARNVWDFVEETPELQLAQYELTVHALRDDRLRPLARKQYERVHEALELVLEDHPEVTEGSHHRDIAGYVISVMDGLILQRIVEDDPAAGRRRLELFIATLPAVAEQVRDGVPAAVANTA
jgi:AcrR family transcriptional regulator